MSVQWFMCKDCMLPFISSAELARHNQEFHHGGNLGSDLAEPPKTTTSEVANGLKVEVLNYSMEHQNLNIPKLIPYSPAPGPADYSGEAWRLCIKTEDQCQQLPTTNYTPALNMNIKQQQQQELPPLNNPEPKRRKKAKPTKSKSPDVKPDHLLLPNLNPTTPSMQQYNHFACRYCGQHYDNLENLQIHEINEWQQFQLQQQHQQQQHQSLGLTLGQGQGQSQQLPVNNNIVIPTPVLPSTSSSSNNITAAINIVVNAKPKRRRRKPPTGDEEEDEAPFKCEECGKQFYKNNSFKAHKKRHTLELIYPCTFCDKRFAERFNLNRHLLSHTKEKPFQCTECGTKFTYRYNLITHESIHHPETALPRVKRSPRKVRFKCRYCEFTHARKKFVTRHENRHEKTLEKEVHGPLTG